MAMIPGRQQGLNQGNSVIVAVDPNTLEVLDGQPTPGSSGLSTPVQPTPAGARLERRGMADCDGEVAGHTGNPGSGVELRHDICRAGVAVAAEETERPRRPPRLPGNGPGPELPGHARG